MSTAHGWAPDPPMVGIRSPIGLVVGSCTSHPGVLGSIPKREEPGTRNQGKQAHPVLKHRVPQGSQAVMARRRRRRPPGGQTTAAGSGGRRAPFSTDTATHTRTARSLACPYSPFRRRAHSRTAFSGPKARPLPPPRVLLPHTYTQDGWFLQPKRRPARLPRRTVPSVTPSNCICRCSRMRARLSPPRVLLPHTCTQDGWFLQPKR